MLMGEKAIMVRGEGWIASFEKLEPRQWILLSTVMLLIVVGQPALVPELWVSGLTHDKYGNEK